MRYPIVLPKGLAKGLVPSRSSSKVKSVTCIKRIRSPSLRGSITHETGNGLVVDEKPQMPLPECADGLDIIRMEGQPMIHSFPLVSSRRHGPLDPKSVQWYNMDAISSTIQKSIP